MRKRNDKFCCYEWYKNDKLHREDGPAVEYDNGIKTWYYNGMIHRLDGPANEGDYFQKWYKNNELHRVDGPAIIRNIRYPGSNFRTKYYWYYEDKIHRLDGPAVIDSNGESWWLHNKKLCDDEIKEHKKLINYKDKYTKVLELNNELYKILNSMILDDDNYYKIPKKIIDHFYPQFRQIYEHSKIQQHPQNI